MEESTGPVGNTVGPQPATVQLDAATLKAIIAGVADWMARCQQTSDTAASREATVGMKHVESGAVIQGSNNA